jgi:hypothetical protein
MEAPVSIKLKSEAETAATTKSAFKATFKALTRRV